MENQQEQQVDENQLTKSERAELRNERKKDRKLADKKQEQSKKIVSILGWLVFIGVIVGGLVWLVSQSQSLPPTVMQGHIEESPESHVSREPMLDAIQRHMLEHSDGDNSPGRIIQYNCDKYDCEDGLIDKLEAYAEEFSETVYVAPNTYDGKIILTKLGSRLILDEFDDEAIRKFIIE